MGDLTALCANAHPTLMSWADMATTKGAIAPGAESATTKAGPAHASPDTTEPSARCKPSCTRLPTTIDGLATPIIHNLRRSLPFLSSSNAHSHGLSPLPHAIAIHTWLFSASILWLFPFCRKREAGTMQFRFTPYK